MQVKPRRMVNSIAERLSSLHPHGARQMTLPSLSDITSEAAEVLWVSPVVGVCMSVPPPFVDLLPAFAVVVAAATRPRWILRSRTWPKSAAPTPKPNPALCANSGNSSMQEVAQESKILLTACEPNPRERQISRCRK